MKILHLIESSEAGGAENVFAGIIRGLDRSRFLSCAGISGNGQWLRTLLADSDTEITQFSRSKTLDRRFLADLVRQVRQQKPDLLHSHMFTMNLYGALTSLLTRVPLVCTIHDTCYDLATTKRLLLYRFIISVARKLVTVSNDMRHQVEEEFHRPGKTACIINGVGLAAPNGIDRQALRNSLGFSPEDFILLSVGNLYAVKNQSLLLDVLNLLRDGIVNCKLAVLGEGPLRRELEEKIRSLALEDSVLLPGLRDDVSTWLSCADVFLLPSHSEGLSISLLEAMAHSLPVLASDAGGNKDIIDPQQNGILIESGLARDYAEQILRLHTDRQLRQKLGEQARATVFNKFDTGRMVRQYEDLYTAVLSD